MGLKINGNTSSITTTETWSATELENVSFSNVPAPSSDKTYQAINASASGNLLNFGFRDLNYWQGELSENAVISDEFELINGHYIYAGAEKWIDELVFTFDRQDGTFILEKISLNLDGVTNRKSFEICSSTYSARHAECSVSIFAIRTSHLREAGMSLYTDVDGDMKDDIESTLDSSNWNIYYEEADFSPKIDIIGKLSVSSDLHVASDLHLTGRIYIEEL